MREVSRSHGGEAASLRQELEEVSKASRVVVEETKRSTIDQSLVPIAT